jgi:aldehyde:ferredoxin oxidoreductase
MNQLYGYFANIARVDLASRKVRQEELSLAEYQRWVGGTGLGVRYLREEVPTGCAWDQEENKLIIAAGPLTGTGFSGGGGFSAVGIGPMTGFAGCSQANGFFGAYLKRSGIDALVIEGISDSWVYLLAERGRVHIRDARGLLGLDTFETEQAVLKELCLNSSKASVYSIGVAGENGVSYACIAGDKGHVASKNGLGSVLGHKRVKAFAALNGKYRPVLYDPEAFSRTRRAASRDSIKAFNGIFHKSGTGALVGIAHDTGVLPVKNYQTNIFPDHMALDAQTTRAENAWTRETCFACRVAHCASVTIAKGPHAGLTAPEPEYEALAAFGSQLLISDYGSVVHLATLADKLGMDANELGWVLGFVMEAYQEKRLTRTDLDGLEMVWGNASAVENLMRMIAEKRGIGELLAKGVRRAVQELGTWAEQMAVFTYDGTSPRGHDHRGRWSELLDTCLSSTSTIEYTFGGPQGEILGLDPVKDPFDPMEVAQANAAVAGWRQFDDCMVVCRFAASDPDRIVSALNAATGWDWELQDALLAGMRINNALRQIKLASGVRSQDERPSPRYGSRPHDGPARDRDVSIHFTKMREGFFKEMGWDEKTGEPLPHTLKGLELE